jgi:hypothetical protein
MSDLFSIKTFILQDVKEWERRMRLREFFSDQNEKEDVLTDDQKHYNFIKKKKSNWTENRVFLSLIFISFHLRSMRDRVGFF